MEEIVTKTCTKCKQKLDLSCFYKAKDTKDGLQYRCKICCKQHASKYYLENTDEILARNKVWRDTNPEKVKRRRRKYHAEHKEEANAYQRMHYYSNKSSYRARDAKRRAMELNATPSWLTEEDFEYMKDLYEACRAFKLFTGLTYHVDHIIPLQSNTVCGLHVPWNLQILEASENIRKSNFVD